MMTGEITKHSTPATTFHEPTGEEIPWVHFEYGPLKTCLHTRGQVSVSMNADPIIMIHTSQQSTK